MSVSLALYFLAIVADGDYLNDWLTWQPDWSAPAIQGAGWLLSLALGY